MPNNINANRTTKGAIRSANASDTRFHGKNRKINEPGGERLSDRGKDDHKGIEVCQDCGAVHHNDRWYRKDKAPEEIMRDAQINKVLCLACKQIHDRNPGGILTLSGTFLSGHHEEIMNLIRHEDENAQGINPLEKIMEIDPQDDDSLVITTTNEFLVQRLGKKVHSAYSGDIEIKFGGQDVPVRVNWHRDLPTENGNKK